MRHGFKKQTINNEEKDIMMKGSPILITSYKDRGAKINKIDSQPKLGMDEAWLQKVIFDHPYILPVESFDEKFAPLISLGREVQTPSGAIDNFYISPWGKITIVETKLWRNPEKHRTVVAQIIDYAKEVSKWDYNDFETAVLKSWREAVLPEKKSPYRIIEPHIQNIGLSEVDFQERVGANLQTGEFLLLIVGDRISPNVALLSEAISGSPGLEFTIGLIELHLYPLKEEEDPQLLIIPDIVGKTVEKTRSIVRIQYQEEKPKVSVEVSEGEQKGKTTLEIFLQQTPDELRQIYEHWLQVWNKKNFIIYWGVTGFSLRVKVKGKLQTILDAYPNWAVSLIRKSDAEKLQVSQEDYQNYLDGLSNIPQAFNLVKYDKKYIKHDLLTPDDLMVILQTTDKLADTILTK